MNEIQKQISKIIRAFVLSLTVGLGGVFVIAIMAVVAAVMSKGLAPSGGILVALVVVFLIFVGVLIWTYVMYLSGLRGFGKRLDAIGNSAMQSVFWSSLLPMIGYVVSIPLFIVSPFLGVSVFCLAMLVTIVLYVRGYLMLPRSTSLNEDGVKGAKILRTAMILSMSSYALSLIYIVTIAPTFMETFDSVVPMMPNYSVGMMAWMIIFYFALFVFGILALIFTFMGWGKIRKSFAQ